MIPPVYNRLFAAARAQGCLLFTVTVSSDDGTQVARAFSSHPKEYPVLGTKPIDRDAWYDHVMIGLNSFIANTPAAFEQLFFDHALITAMGLGSALNIPLVAEGRVLGTLNFLAEAHHFTPTKLAAYHAMIQADHQALAKAMQGG